MTTLAEYTGSRELLTNLTLRELRGKYKRSVLGLGVVAAQPAGHDGHLHSSSSASSCKIDAAAR